MFQCHTSINFRYTIVPVKALKLRFGRDTVTMKRKTLGKLTNK